jgi:uncharacterized membrane protein YheB (UPF0754 family)
MLESIDCMLDIFISTSLKLFNMWRIFLYHPTNISSKIAKLILYVLKRNQKGKKQCEEATRPLVAW